MTRAQFRSKQQYLFGSKRHAKLARLKAKGMLPTQAELKAMAAAATAGTAPVTACPPSPPLDLRTIHSVNPDRAIAIIKALR